MSEVAELDPKYEVVKKLREGGMGSIYLVRHRLLEELRVVKVLRGQVDEDRDLEERFIREAKTAIQLRHPNIAQLYDFAVGASGRAYIVMEYIEGVNLDEWRRDRETVDVSETIAIARQALRALEFLHRKGYVHRDISPDNLMLTRDADGHPLVKLIDLGIVKILREDSQATATSLYLGKPRYSSPEQLASPQVDARSDLYSFGVMLYELVTGRYPISGQDLPSIVTGHLYLPPLDFDVSDVGGAVPESLRKLILQALAKKPEDRPPSAEAFGRRLAEIQREIQRRADDAKTAAKAAEVVRLLAETEQAIAARKLPEALAKLGEVLHEAPNEPRAQALRERLDAAFSAGQTMGLGDTQPFRTGAGAAAAGADRGAMPLAPTVPLPPVSEPGERGEAAAAEPRPHDLHLHETAPPTLETTGRGRRGPSPLALAAIAAAVVAVGVALFVAWPKLRGGKIRAPEEYAKGVAALERRDYAAAVPLLRTAAGRDPLERDGYLPFFRLGLALAESGECDAAEVAFVTSREQKVVERSTEALAAITAARASCARTGLEPEIAAFEKQLTDLEGKAAALARDRANPALTALWSDPALGQELDRVRSLLGEARAHLATARSRGSREPLFTAQDRYADAQLALGALLKKLSGG